jgi:hypothetical protein
MKEKDFTEKFYVTKEQMLEILKKNVLPKAPFEIRILHTNDDKYFVMVFNPSKGEGRVLLPTTYEDEKWINTVLGKESDKCVTEKINIKL